MILGWFVATLVVTAVLLTLKLTVLFIIPWWALLIPMAAYLIGLFVVVASFVISGAIILHKIWKALKAYVAASKERAKTR